MDTNLHTDTKVGENQIRGGLGGFENKQKYEEYDVLTPITSLT